MIEINISSDIDRVAKQLDDLGRKQLPFATSLALNRTMQAAQRIVTARILTNFNSPTLLTQKAVLYTKATKANLQASIFLRDEATKGTPPAKYLRTQIVGGARVEKRFERALIAAGLMPRGWLAVPGTGERRDAYGNFSRGLYTQILSDLRAFSEVGFSANRLTKAQARERGKRYRRSRFFVVRPGGQQQPGIYRRFETAFGVGVRPVFIFVRSTSYTPRLPFADIIRRAVATHFPAEFDAALRQAIATAIRK